MQNIRGTTYVQVFTKNGANQRGQKIRQLKLLAGQDWPGGEQCGEEDADGPLGQSEPAQPRRREAAGHQDQPQGARPLLVSLLVLYW